jgi:hypothetical protein
LGLSTIKYFAKRPGQIKSSFVTSLDRKVLGQDADLSIKLKSIGGKMKINIQLSSKPPWFKIRFARK